MKQPRHTRSERGGAAPSEQRGAALLLAMIVLTLIATTAAAMVWQQQRAIHVEGAERARTQAYWMLDAGIDLGRYLLRERSEGNPQNGAPWDLAFEEARLSSLLAVDRDNNADSNLDAFMSGRIDDANARYNLRNLVKDDGEPNELEKSTLERLCRLAGVEGFAPAIIGALSAARKPAVNGPLLDSTSATTPVITRVEHLRWLGINEAQLARLMQLVDLLPSKGMTKLNLNTASAEVIEAVLGPEFGTGIGQRLARVNGPKTARFNSLDQAKAAGGLPEQVNLPDRVEVRSDFFYLTTTVRFEDRALMARALVERQGTGRNAPIHIHRLERGPLPPGASAATVALGAAGAQPSNMAR